MSNDRLRHRVRDLMTMRAVLSCTLALLVVSSGSLVVFDTAAAAPDGIDDGATFTVRTGAIHPHLDEGGQICAEKTSSSVNKVTVTNATLKNVDIYLGKEDGVKAHISFPSGEVNGALVLYTNGENPLVNTLSLLGVCLPPGTPNPMPTTLEAYWLGVSNLQPNNIEVTSGGDAPEASGPSLQKVLKTTNTSTEEIGVNNSTDLTNRLLKNSSEEWVTSDNAAPIINNTTENDTTTTATATITKTIETAETTESNQESTKALPEPTTVTTTNTPINETTTTAIHTQAEYSTNANEP